MTSWHPKPSGGPQRLRDLNRGGSMWTMRCTRRSWRLMETSSSIWRWGFTKPSMDWIKKKITGKPHDLHGKIYGLSVKFPLNQSIETSWFFCFLEIHCDQFVMFVFWGGWRDKTCDTMTRDVTDWSSPFRGYPGDSCRLWISGDFPGQKDVQNYRSWDKWRFNMIQHGLGYRTDGTG